MIVTVLVDTAYAEQVAGGIREHFSQELGRNLPPVDLPNWLDCLVLDAGLRPGDNQVQVVLIHPKNTTTLQQFIPCDFSEQLDGQAFKDNLGEFSFHSVCVEDIVSTEQLISDCINAAEPAPDLTIVVSPQAPKGKAYTLCNMQPEGTDGHPHVVLGFSILAGLGISPSEI